MGKKRVVVDAPDGVNQVDLVDLLGSAVVSPDGQLKLETTELKQEGVKAADPRYRTSLASDLALTTDWQRIDLSGSSSLNANEFRGTAPSKLVDWDASGDKFTFNGADTQNFRISLELTFDVSAGTFLDILSQQCLGDDRAIVDFRFSIPSSPAVNFPFPDSRESVRLFEAPMGVLRQDSHINYTVYATSLLRTNGLEVCLKKTGGRSITLKDAVCIFYPG